MRVWWVIDDGKVPGIEAVEWGQTMGVLQRERDGRPGLSGSSWACKGAEPENDDPVRAGSLSSTDDSRGAIKKGLMGAFAYGPRFGPELYSKLRLIAS